MLNSRVDNIASIVTSDTSESRPDELCDMLTEIGNRKLASITNYKALNWDVFCLLVLHVLVSLTNSALVVVLATDNRNHPQPEFIRPCGCRAPLAD